MIASCKPLESYQLNFPEASTIQVGLQDGDAYLAVFLKAYIPKDFHLKLIFQSNTGEEHIFITKPVNYLEEDANENWVYIDAYKFIPYFKKYSKLRIYNNEYSLAGFTAAYKRILAFEN